MESKATVLLVGDNKKQFQELSALFSFIGEVPKFCCLNKMSEQLAVQAWTGALLLDPITDRELSLMASQPHQPFISLQTKNLAELPPNHIGSLDEPFSYPQMAQLLHHCQTYRQHLPNTKQRTTKNQAVFQGLVGRGLAMLEIRHLIEQVAVTKANVLVLGESGTGKEVIAKAIHDCSDRSIGPFVPINCGAIPAELLESELFGHEKGAFTGAFSSRKGRFELAAGGTIFLDEIGDMPMPMQVKLLRVLQERTFERVGGVKQIDADVRVIAATHRDLDVLIKEGGFREDLYYRLNVFPIESPALRERQDDVPLLLQEMINRHEQMHEAQVRFTQRAIESLMLHSWPGNVRELSNLVERLLILFPGHIVDIPDLPIKYRHIDAQEFEPKYADELTEREALLAIFSDEPVEEPLPSMTGAAEAFPDDVEAVSLPSALPESGLNLKKMLADFEIEMIEQALLQQDGVVARAAEQLEMRRTTLVEKMKKYGIEKN